MTDYTLKEKNHYSVMGNCFSEQYYYCIDFQTIDNKPTIIFHVHNIWMLKSFIKESKEEQWVFLNSILREEYATLSYAEFNSFVVLQTIKKDIETKLGNNVIVKFV